MIDLASWLGGLKALGGGSFKGLHFLFDVVIHGVRKATMDASSSIPVRLDDLLYALEALFSGCGRNGRQKFVNCPFGHRDTVCMALGHQPAQAI